MNDFSTINIWKNVSPEKWSDWHWQMQNVITTLDELEEVLDISQEERNGVKQATQFLKMRISPHIISLMDHSDSRDSLRKQFVPSILEMASQDDANLYGDVNADDKFSPMKGLVHRYPSKVLLFPSNYCGSYCRYCFRRKLAREVEETLSEKELSSIFTYIKNNSTIEEVILSGGDPLVLGDDFLEYILKSLSSIPHVHLLRIHSRMPVTIPYRITPSLVNILTKYKPLFMVIHIDTAKEISIPTQNAISLLVDSGIPCFASSPLLKGVNDSENALRNLWTKLLENRVKPYYLFHSDPVKGLRHFLVPLDKGLRMMYSLYDNMSGLAMPHYCFNAPGGGGHVLLNNNYVTKVSDGHYKITTFEGLQMDYFEMDDKDEVK